MTTASVASLRPAPTMALYGLAAIFLCLLVVAGLLVPAALLGFRKPARVRPGHREPSGTP
ncbi:hypothetical protein [Streptomyces roseolus]|uniref:hypothetical protein n=1 Tax=Streptomyces roseolus TaxID=67358 RepID=UPI00198F622D|nr:hypothetical protein [Streptomyces roseolus]GGR15768.1 hypothetical protein GCM10010282_05040 [Streptomyces roseolus]